MINNSATDCSHFAEIWYGV